MNELFEYPVDQPAAKASRLPQPVTHSHVVTVPSKYGKDVAYARLSDSEHEYARNVIEILHSSQNIMQGILSQPSGLFGQHSRSKQTYGDVLDGLMAKLRLPHPKVRGRRGEDFSVKQLKALNSIIASVNALLSAEEAIAPVAVP